MTFQTSKRSANKPTGKRPSKRKCKQGESQQATIPENESTPEVISHPDHEDSNLKEKTQELAAHQSSNDELTFILPASLGSTTTPAACSPRTSTKKINDDHSLITIGSSTRGGKMIFMNELGYLYSRSHDFC